MNGLNVRPRRIEWAAPEGWTIWADEDGVHLRTARGDLLEQPDVLRLIDLYATCRAAFENSDVLPPRPPSKEQAREMYADQRVEHLARVAASAVRDAINPPAATPF